MDQEKEKKEAIFILVSLVIVFLMSITIGFFIGRNFNDASLNENSSIVTQQKEH